MTAPGLALSPGGRLLLIGVIAACHGMIFLRSTETPSLAVSTPMAVTIIAAGEAAIEIPEAVAAASAAAPAPPESAPQADDPERAADRQVAAEPSLQTVETPASAIRVETSAKLPQIDSSRPVRDRRPIAEPNRPPSRLTARTSYDKGDAAATRVRTRLGASAGEQARNATSRASYAALVIAEFNRHKVYPESARQNHQQGTASLSFVIGTTGELIRYKVTRSTGNDVLDRAIDSMMKAARPPPPPDGDFRGHFIVRFSLND